MEPIVHAITNCAHVRNFKPIVAQKEPHGKTAKVCFLLKTTYLPKSGKFLRQTGWIYACFHSIILAVTNVFEGE